MKKLIFGLALLVAGCESGSYSSGDSSTNSGGGSMARFTIADDYLYTVDERNLNVVSVKRPAEPVKVDKMTVGADIETIFATGGRLFIGSRGAMYIYDIAKTPQLPDLLSSTSHFRSCDPIVAAGNYAYMTLNSTQQTSCSQGVNELWVYDITDVTKPSVVYVRTLSSPRGLALDDDTKMLFVCDGDNVKAFDVTDPKEVELATNGTTAEVDGATRIVPYDCIVLPGNRLLVVGAGGLYKLEYNKDGFTRLLSKI